MTENEKYVDFYNKTFSLFNVSVLLKKKSLLFSTLSLNPEVSRVTNINHHQI